jgi:pyrroloquinoline quinone biosynthesis protein B
MKLRILRGALAPLGDRGAIAVASDDGAWALVNLSPAVALELGPERRPATRHGLPASAPAAVILTDAHIDHVAGLLSLREGDPLALYATPAVFEDLTASLPMLTVLDHYCGVHWHMVPVAGDRRVAEFQVHGLPGLQFSALAIEAPAPPWSAHGDQPVAGDTIALVVRDLATGQSAFCAPGLAQIGPDEFGWMRQADCVLIDAPSDDNPGAPAPGEPPWVDLLAGIPARHKVLWDRHGVSAPAAQPTRWAQHGIELAYDGMEIVL